jgi:hypothetical protein
VAGSGHFHEIGAPLFDTVFGITCRRTKINIFAHLDGGFQPQSKIQENEQATFHYRAATSSPSRAAEMTVFTISSARRAVKERQRERRFEK